VLKLDAERYQKWIKVGAKPSGTLASIVRRSARAAKTA
jgi:ribosomal protein S16